MIPSFFGSIVNPITPFNPSNFKESVQNLTITSKGSPILSTAQKKFGSSSIKFSSSTNDGLSLPNNTAWNISANDGGFDFWLYLLSESSYPNEAGFIGQSVSAADQSWLFQDYGTGNGTIGIGKSGSAPLNTPSNTLQLNQWQHWEVNKVSGTTRIFCNGTQVAIGTGTYWNTSSNPLRMGYTASGGEHQSFNSYMDELRFFDSAHAHTNNFTPPTTPYVNADALALFHFDG